MLDSLFLLVLNMSITASFVIFGVLLVRLCLKKAPKIFSFALWAVVLFRLLCPFSFESVLSILPNNIAPISQDILYSQAPQINTGIGIVDNSINPVLPIPNMGDSVNPLQVWSFIGSLVWIIGIMVLLIYSIATFIKLKRKLRVSTPLRDNIYLADHINSPFVLGLIKPKIYLPSSLSRNEQDFIIAHEAYHIKRFDHITRILAFIALTFHWLNPLVWLAFILSGKDMELSCDEAVTKQMDSDIRVEYSQSLLRFATGRKMLHATPLAFGEGDTKSRVKNVLSYKKPAFWVIVVSVLAVVAVGVALMANPLNSSVISPYVQEYIPGQGNIRGNVDTEKYEKISPDFSIGAEQYGVAVFKTPDIAFETFKHLYAEGIAYIQKANDLPPLSQKKYDLYKIYGWQTTGGTKEQVSQAEFVSRLLDIYENRFEKQSPNTDYVEPTVEAEATLNDLRPMIMVDGILYLDTNKEISAKIEDSAVLGEITSAAFASEKPTENGQCNFSSGVGAKYAAYEDGMTVFLDNKWFFFEKEVTLSSQKLTHDQAVSSALFSLSDRYLEGECISEGHIILGYDDSDKNKTKIYALTEIGWYGFENNNFAYVSGSAFPAVITLSSDNTAQIELPLDGSDNAASIEKMFPKEYHDKIFKYGDAERDNLKRQREKYASEYLAKIGRNAKIGGYSDFEYTSLTDEGVSAEVSDNLQDFYKAHSYYPSFVGTREQLENGVRMVYEMSYLKNQDEIRFSKYDYETRTIKEQFTVDAKTGNIIE